MSEAEKLLGQIRGIVETLEQKSGINPLLFLVALITPISLILYSCSDKIVFIYFAAIPLFITLTFYGIAFFIDRNFLRSEKHVKEMRQMDMLGEKGKEINDSFLISGEVITDNNPPKIGGNK